MTEKDAPEPRAEPETNTVQVPGRETEQCSSTSPGGVAPITPGSNDISEDAQPGAGAPVVASPRTPDDDDRRYIAWIMLAILALTVAVGLINWCARDLSADQMQGFQMIFTPLVTLVASVLGFYFSRKK